MERRIDETQGLVRVPKFGNLRREQTGKETQHQGEHARWSGRLV